MVFFRGFNASKRKTIVPNTPKNTNTVTATTTTKQTTTNTKNIEATGQEQMNTFSHCKQHTAIPPHTANKSNVNNESTDATKVQNNEIRKKTEKSINKTIPGTKNSGSNEMISESTDAQANSGINNQNESFILDIVMNLDNSTEINNSVNESREFGNESVHRTEALDETANRNTSVGKFNTSAIPFCPSGKIRNVQIANIFPKNLNLVYANLQGMLEACHFDEFVNEISKTKNIHMCPIVETWLRHGVNTNKSVNMDGFKIFRSDRKTGKRDRNKGGGVALYVKTDFGCKIIKKSSDIGSEITGAEYLLAEIKGKITNFFVAVIYRTNDCNATNTTQLFNVIIEESAKYEDVIIIGDLNINILNDTTKLKTMGDHFTVINDNCPTHEWPGAAPTLIDIAMTRKVNRISCFAHYNIIPTTHHDLIFVSYKAKPIRNNKSSIFNYRKYDKLNINEIAEDLNGLNWSNFFRSSNINEKIEIFNEHFFKMFDKHVPIVEVKLKTASKPGFTGELNEKLKIRKSLYENYKADRGNDLDIKKRKKTNTRKCAKK